MSALTARPARPLDVVALQYAQPNRMVGIPLLILGTVVVLTIAISIAVLRAGGRLTDSSQNGWILWSVIGYTVAVGVQNVGTSFPFALALGATRRTFVLGNLLTAAAQAALVAAAALALLGLETATGGWFIGASVLRVQALGNGDPAQLAGAMFLSILLALSVGSVFGAAWIRFGPLGPLLLSAGSAAVVALLLLLLVPFGGAISAAARPWWPVAAATLVVVLALGAQYLFLRRASVR